MTNTNSLIIADPHLPFVHRHYLDFCNDVKRRYKCGRVTCTGDIADSHAISYHESDPDGMSAGDELSYVKKTLKSWYKAFPKVKACIGNHDALVRRKMMTAGLPTAYLKSFGEILGAPAGWEWAFEWKFKNWRLVHGTNSSGDGAALKLAIRGRISTAIGHLHSKAGVSYHANDDTLIWGMICASGINRRAYAFNYGRDFTDKPILGVGVVLEDGKLPLFIPMPL